jgi:hypothetical protein
VTYVNHIVSGDGWDGLPHVDQVLSAITEVRGEILGGPEFTRFSAQYIILERDEPLGRLYVGAEPAFKGPENTPMLLLTITARGRPPTADSEGVGRFLDIGHRWVTKGFADMTTKSMHEFWGRTQ